WLGSTEGFDYLYSADTRWEGPVVVWTTPSLDDRLNVFRTCSWLCERRLRRRDVLVIDLPPTPRGPGARPRSEPFRCSDSVFYQSKEALQAHLALAQPWPRKRYDNAVKLWERFTDHDPRPFARRCLAGVRSFPELGPLWEFLSRFFPRLMADES